MVLVSDEAAEVGTSKAAARIRAAAVQMFAEKGYGATSLRDISSTLGLSAGAVYPHYKTKESLLYAISLEGHNGALLAVVDAASRGVMPVDRLADTVAAYVEWHAVHQALARVVQYELRSLSNAHFRRIATIRRQTSAVFAEIIDQGVAAGAFVVDDADAVVLAISSLCIDVSRWFPTRRHQDPSEISQTYVDLVKRMIVA